MLAQICIRARLFSENSNFDLINLVQPNVVRLSGFCASNLRVEGKKRSFLFGIVCEYGATLLMEFQNRLVWLKRKEK